jgi:hypothetical protein
VPKGLEPGGPSGALDMVKYHKWMGECYTAAHPTSGVSEKGKSVTPTSISLARIHATSARTSNSFARRTERVEGLMTVAAGFTGPIISRS